MLFFMDFSDATPSEGLVSNLTAAELSSWECSLIAWED